MEKENPEAYSLLQKFAGHWKTEGVVAATSDSSETYIQGTDSYEWLPGEFFLLHQADVMMGNEKSQTHEIIGFDKALGKFTMQHYNNKGESGFMTAACVNAVWTFTGDNLKFTGGFKKNDSEFSGIWEQSADGKSWSLLMHIKLIKVDYENSWKLCNITEDDQPQSYRQDCILFYDPNGLYGCYSSVNKISIWGLWKKDEDRMIITLPDITYEEHIHSWSESEIVLSPLNQKSRKYYFQV